MNEIEKMYENAGIELIRECFNGDCAVKDEIGYDKNICDNRCVYIDEKYPPFTAEKQLELIKWISHHDGCFEVHLNSIEFGDSGFGCCSTFEESFARAVNNFLKSATEKEKEKVKEILK